MRTYHERANDIQEKLKAKKKRKTLTWVGAISCVLAFLVVFNLTLFLPFETGGAPDLSLYRDSEYYAVMEKISPLVFTPRHSTCNFNEWAKHSVLLNNIMPEFSPGGTDFEANAPQDAPTSPDGTAPDTYIEVTDNQTAGMVEGDLFKRSQNYLFYLTEETPADKETELVLRAYTIAGEQSKLCGEVKLAPERGFSFQWYTDSREMYLSPDLKTVTVLVPCYHTATSTLYSANLYTAIITVDTQNVDTMSVKRVQYLSGNYISSRLCDGQLLIVNNFAVRRNPDFGDVQSFLPHFGEADAFEPIPAENILYPETVNLAKFTVLAAVDTASGQLTDCEALLYFSDDVYVSEHNVYVNSYAYRAEYQAGPFTSADVTSFTDVTRISFEGGMFEVGPSASICGTIKDRYCMDEYDGYFRIFADVPSITFLTQSPSAPWAGAFATTLQSSVSLFIFDAETMQAVSAVERFAPDMESVQSARFDGDKAYVCTAVLFTDPVYVFDLSDPENISSKDTGTIPGYSVALKKFFGGTLLGIGYGEAGNAGSSLKVELYEETEDTITPLTAFETPAYFSENYKSYFIRADLGLVGIGIRSLSGDNALRYLLLRFDGYQFVNIATFSIADYEDARAFYADGWFYLVDPSGLQVKAFPGTEATD